MFPIKKIVCPVDFSDPSLEGLKAALELAQKESAELMLMHAIQPVQPHLDAVQDHYHAVEEAARKAFEELVKTKVPEGLRVKTKVVRGQPADEIVQAAESENADIIVIATHGWTGWRRFIFGSVAGKVVRLSSCPVLTIPDPGSLGQ